MNPRHRRVGAVVVGAMACSFAACSIGVDFDQYSKGNGAQLSDDGSTSLADSAPDVDEIDAGFCPDPTAVTLCDDFDGHQDAGWMTVTEHGGTLRKSDADFASPPFSLLITRPEVGDAGYSAGGYLWRDINPAFTHAVIEADIKPCALTNGVTNLIALFDQSGAFVAFGFAFDGAAPKTYVLTSTSATTIVPYLVGDLPPTDRFFHVKWTLDFHPTAGRMAVEIDGHQLIDVGNIGTTNPNVTRRAFQVGAYGAEGSACTANIDNVLVDAR